MINGYPRIYFAFIILFITAGCDNNRTQFNKISPVDSGITFNNTIIETDSFNVLSFHYIYNGGGIGVGDFDKDGLEDLVFIGNQSSSKIYKNEGGFHFADVTQSSNFNPKGWSTGVAVIDINEDGWLDIYVSTGGVECNLNCYNYLYINNGNGKIEFTESAAEFGLLDPLYTQQAAFFDFDLDGDLDVFLVHNAIDGRDKNSPISPHLLNTESKDLFLENQAGYFVDISDSLGLSNPGYGLGVVVADFNNDDLPDLYVANDFLTNDHMYLNNGSDTTGKHLGFRNVIKEAVAHSSYNAMGVDIGDINNDNLQDIVVLDMLPDENERLKSMLGFMNYNKFLLTQNQGYLPQFVKNTLQLNNGSSHNTPTFNEISNMAGIAATDWSWAPLLADFDNDGDKDLFVTNGYGKDITDLDFINYTKQLSPFGTKNSYRQALYQELQKMEPIKLRNKYFVNDGRYKFNQNKDHSDFPPSISNGAAYADLDNDGDLDLVVNNINSVAHIYENKNEEISNNNWIKLDFQESSLIGSKIKISTRAKDIYSDYAPIRGYLSSVGQYVIVGIGNENTADVEIVFPGGKVARFAGIKAKTTVRIKKENYESSEVPLKESPFFIYKNHPEHFHKENFSIDFDQQRLLLSQFSNQGPCLEILKLDGEEVVFMGGTAGHSSSLINVKNGTITALEYSNSEDVASIAIDLDGDGIDELYVVSGGSRFPAGKDTYQDRIYKFNADGDSIEMMYSPLNSSGSCVALADFDNDGDDDLFIGSSHVPGMFPDLPMSYLLENEMGTLKIHNPLILPDSGRLGMISDAVWLDIDHDNDQDLIVAGKWMPIKILINNDGNFQEYIDLKNSEGLWRSLEVADLDNDGDIDLLAGNIGLNSALNASVENPLLLFTGDLDNNGFNDPMIGYLNKNSNGDYKLFPFHSRDDVMLQIPKLKSRIKTYKDYGETSFLDLIGNDNLKKCLAVKELSSIALFNNGMGEFKKKKLPIEAQFSCINDFYIDDVNNDGHLDFISVNNDYTREKNFGWLTGTSASLFLGDGNNGFSYISPNLSGLQVLGPGMSIVKPHNEEYILGINNQPLVTMKKNK